MAPTSLAARSTSSRSCKRQGSLEQEPPKRWGPAGGGGGGGADPRRGLTGCSSVAAMVGAERRLQQFSRKWEQALGYLPSVSADMLTSVTSSILIVIHFLQNFETAVQENITINGEPWQETSDEDELQSSDIKILEDQFDELIVETASKRKQCPRKILVHIIKTIKAEQEILKLYKPVVKPQEIRPEPSQGKHYLSLPALIERAEGFSQALALQPVLELCKLRQEVFAGCKAKEENKIQSLVTKVEITPTDTAAKKNSVLKRRRPSDAIQLACYPLRRKRISLNT
uniref:NSL1 component of MIS12 kinetochore complex n=1 Tax=Crocodylus porosus TaxID=8502 RepID=A0A7M4DVV2_CROPO